jgi:hypothetical protein
MKISAESQGIFGCYWWGGPPHPPSWCAVGALKLLRFCFAPLRLGVRPSFSRQMHRLQPKTENCLKYTPRIARRYRRRGRSRNRGGTWYSRPDRVPDNSRTAFRPLNDSPTPPALPPCHEPPAGVLRARAGSLRRPYTRPWLGRSGYI